MPLAGWHSSTSGPIVNFMLFHPLSAVINLAHHHHRLAMWPSSHVVVAVCGAKLKFAPRVLGPEPNRNRILDLSLWFCSWSGQTEIAPHT